MPAIDMKKWLGELQLGEGQKKLFEAVLADDAAAKVLGEHIMTRSDYSRAQDALRDEEKRLRAAIAEGERKNSEYYTSVSGWFTQNKEALTSSQAAVATMKEKLAKVSERLQGIKSAYSIDDNEIKDVFELAKFDGVVAPGAPAAVVADKNSPYVTREDFDKAVAGTTDFVFVPAILHDINVQHQRLFGKSLENTEQLVTEAIAAKKDLKAYAEEKYKFHDRQKELDEDVRKRDLAEAEKRGEERARSEMANVASRPVGTPVAPILTAKIPRASEERNPNRGLERAMSTYGTHGSGG